MAGPVPSLAPVNGLIANLAAWQSLGILTGVRPPMPYVFLDLAGNRLQAFESVADPHCPICGEDGETAMGDLLPWPQFGAQQLPSNIPEAKVGDA